MSRIKLFVFTGLVSALSSCSQPLKPNPPGSGPADIPLADVLRSKNYVPVRLTKSNTGHFLIRVRVDKDTALFILDTGASGTCIDNESAKKFGIALHDVAGGATGYGGEEKNVRAGNVTVTMDSFTRKSLEITAIDLSSVNQAYATEGAGHIDGVIGADILEGGNAIIDYMGHTLWLKR